MAQHTGSARAMSEADLDWVLDILTERRARLAPYAPVYWRPAPDARERHAAFLRAQVRGNVSGARALRTDHGLLFAAPRRADRLALDDVALDDDGTWESDGSALTGALGEASVRFVCPVPEPDRLAFAESLGLRLAESWWHRELTPGPQPDERPGRLDAAGAEVRLVDVPPVYAPGGPAAYVTRADGLAALRAAERAGARAGAVLCVVRQTAADSALGSTLAVTGYRRHCDFLDGDLRQPGRQATSR